MHRVLTTKTGIERLRKLAPIGEIELELLQFDMQQLENPEISGIEYQQGELQDCYEVRDYLLEKCDRKCACYDAENIPYNVPEGKYKGTLIAIIFPVSDGIGEFTIDKKQRSIGLEYCTTLHRKDCYSYA